MARRKTEFEESLIQNMRTYNLYVYRLMEIAISSWEWENLPITCDEIYMEKVLFNQAMAIFFQDDVLENFLALRCIINGPLDVYDIPIRRRAVANNGYNYLLNPTNSVIIYNNALRINTFPIVIDFAKRLWNLDQIVKVNANAQKTPVLIRGTENQQLTLKNTYLKWDGNQPVIYADDSFNPDSLSVLKTDAPWVAGDVYNLKVNIWNEALTFLGVSNLAIQKKERLLTDEVTRAMGGVMANRRSRLKARRRACDQINDLFGLDISVHFEEFDGDLNVPMPKSVWSGVPDNLPINRRQEDVVY